MSKDLTNSPVDRSNVLNNRYALEATYERVGWRGIAFEAKVCFTKAQLARLFEVDTRTIDRILEHHRDEISNNGYELLQGNRLRAFKEAVKKHVDQLEGHDIDVATLSKELDNEWDSISITSQLGVFTFRTALNIGMLLTTSERAKEMRGLVLDVVIDVLNERLGGSTKYINQREEEFLPSAYRELNYREVFTNAIDDHVEGKGYKYGLLTDRVYKAIFKENAKEYRQILNLHSKESVRSTMYTEVLDVISNYENGFAVSLKTKSEELGRKLALSEAFSLFKKFDSQMAAVLEPSKEKARNLMASRDMAFRDALHEKLKDYVSSVSSEDFDKFLGERSKSLEERIKENEDVFKRLRDR